MFSVLSDKHRTEPFVRDNGKGTDRQTTRSHKLQTDQRHSERSGELKIWLAFWFNLLQEEVSLLSFFNGTSTQSTFCSKEFYHYEGQC